MQRSKNQTVLCSVRIFWAPQTGCKAGFPAAPPQILLREGIEGDRGKRDLRRQRGSPPRTCERWGFTESGAGNPLKRRGTRRTERPEGTPKLFTIHSYLLTEKSSRCAAQIPFPPNPLTPPSTIVEGARNTFPRWGRGTTKWWMRRTPYGGSKGTPPRSG